MAKTPLLSQSWPQCLKELESKFDILTTTLSYLNNTTLDASMMVRMRMAQGASVLSLWRVSFRNTARVKALQIQNFRFQNSLKVLFTCRQRWLSTWVLRGTPTWECWISSRWTRVWSGWRPGSLWPSRGWRCGHPWNIRHYLSPDHFLAPSGAQGVTNFVCVYVQFKLV